MAINILKYFSFQQGNMYLQVYRQPKQLAQSCRCRWPLHPDDGRPERKGTMEIVITQAYSRAECELMMEIIKAGSAVEKHNTYIGKHIISQLVYRYRGSAYLFVLLNGTVKAFEELKAGD